MTTIRVLKPFSHAGRRYRKGDTLEMQDRFARVMHKIGKAELVPEAPPPPPPSTRTYRRRDMVAESPKAEPEPPAPPPSEPPLDLPALPSSDDK